MLEIKNEKLSIPVVVFAGLLWSFGPLVVRNIDDPGLILWQYLFARGLVIFSLLNIYLFFDEGIEFYKNYLTTSEYNFILKRFHFKTNKFASYKLMLKSNKQKKCLLLC